VAGEVAGEVAGAVAGEVGGEASSGSGRSRVGESRLARRVYYWGRSRLAAGSRVAVLAAGARVAVLAGRRAGGTGFVRPARARTAVS
jgi:hypothetical protein